MDDKIQTCHRKKLTENFNLALLKKTELTMGENKNVMKKVKNRAKQIVFGHHYYLMIFKTRS